MCVCAGCVLALIVDVSDDYVCDFLCIYWMCPAGAVDCEWLCWPCLYMLDVCLLAMYFPLAADLSCWYACSPQLLPLLLKAIKDKTTESQLRDDAVITLSQLGGIGGATLTTHQLTYPHAACLSRSMFRRCLTEGNMFVVLQMVYSYGVFRWAGCRC